MIGGTTGILGEWGPESENNRYEGPMTARQALAKSKNGATVRIGMTVGRRARHSALPRRRDSFAAAPFPRHVSRQQRNHARGTRSRLHDFPKWRMAPERAAHSRSNRGKRRHRRLAESPEEQAAAKVVKPETAYEVHSCLVDALESGPDGRTRKIWPQEISGRGQNRNGLRFYRRALCRLRQLDHLRGLGGIR